MCNGIFLSHDSGSAREALVRKNELRVERGDGWNVFLSSDWESLRVGECWFEGVLHAVERSTEFEALVYNETTFRNLWVNFELGIAVGSKARETRQNGASLQGVSARIDPSVSAGSQRLVTPVADWSKLGDAALQSSATAKVYLSHTLPLKNEARNLADMIRYAGSDNICVETRADVWDRTTDRACRCLASVAAIKACEKFFVFVDRPWDARSPWLSFEVGVAIGLQKPPHIFISGGVGLGEGDIPFPLRGFFWIGTGDQNRWTTIFRDTGLTCGLND
jgi:hypothetical protein